MIRPIQHGNKKLKRGTPFQGRGFTLLELLVVIAIMILLFTIAVPSINNLLKAGKMDQGVNLIGSAAASARSYAGVKPPFTRGQYQGTAMIFAPSNEIRLVQHTETAKYNSTKYLIDESPQAAGYADISDREYIPLPPGLSVVGMIRGVSSGTPETKLLTPPFAVRFDAQGVLISRGKSASVNGRVYYNADYDANNWYDVYDRTDSKVKPDPYEPGRYDPEDPAYDPDTYLVAEGKHILPFGQLETVIGIIVYEKERLREENLSLAVDNNGDIADAETKKWLLNNGEMLMFNRYSGARIRP